MDTTSMSSPAPEIGRSIEWDERTRQLQTARAADADVDMADAIPVEVAPAVAEAVAAEEMLCQPTPGLLPSSRPLSTEMTMQEEREMIAATVTSLTYKMREEEEAQGGARAYRYSLEGAARMPVVIRAALSVAEAEGLLPGAVLSENGARVMCQAAEGGVDADRGAG